MHETATVEAMTGPEPATNITAEQPSPVKRIQDAVVEVSPLGGLVPRDFEGVYRLATIMARSGLMPKGVSTPEAVFVAIQLGLELGLKPMQAVQSIAVINGRPSVWGDAALGLIMATGELELFEELPITRKGEPVTVANLGDFFGFVARGKRRGHAHIVEHTFTLDDAKTAGLLAKDGPWKQYPRRMAQMRARGFCLRDLFPAALRGLLVAEEAQDIIDVTPDAAQPAGIRQRLAAAAQAAEMPPPVTLPDAAPVQHLDEKLKADPQAPVVVIEQTDVETDVSDLVEEATDAPVELDPETLARIDIPTAAKPSGYTTKLAELREGHSPEEWATAVLPILDDVGFRRLSGVPAEARGDVLRKIAAALAS